MSCAAVLSTSVATALPKIVVSSLPLADPACATGASLTAVTAIVVWAVLLVSIPSPTTTVMSRRLVSGFSLELPNTTWRSAAW